MENIVPIADDWFESIDNLDQPEISSASTIFTIRWLESAAWLLIVFRHWLVFVLTLIAFPIAMLLFTFILNIIFSVHPLTKLILFVVQIFGCLGLTHLILDYLNYISEGNLIKKRKKTLYFLSHVQNSLFYLICTTLLLLLFIFFMKPDLMGTNLFQNFITAAIVLFMIGQIFWILSILILKHAYSNYRGKSFLEKMEHLIDQQNVLKALLYGTSIKVYTVSNALHKPVDESQANTLYGLVKQKFTNNASAIPKIDLQRLMNRSEVAEVLKFFPPAEFINLASLKSWMGKVCEERKTLLGLFNDTITAIEDIKPILFFFKGVLFIFAGCYVLGFATPKVLAVIAMPLLVLFLAFYRNLPDGIIFVFKMHWFDIGDCCILADQKLVVKDIGIFTTYFYDENNKIVSISISDLFTKSITNLTRSPMMSETLDVCVSKGTSADDIKKLESGIDKFLRSKPESWSPGYCLSLKEVTIEGPKYALKVTHSTKFENFELNALQISELLDELMTILKDHLISAS